MIGSTLPRQYDAPTSGLIDPEEASWPFDLSDIGDPGVREGAFHVDHLKQQFRDLARPNQFRVRMTPPSNIEADWRSDILVLAKTASFPSVEIQAIEFERCGKILNIPSNKVNFGELSITFHNDVDFNLRTMFLRWQKYACFNWTEDIGTLPKFAFNGSVVVYQFNSQQKPVFAVAFTEAWPKTIGEIQLSHDNESQAEEFQVTFAYTIQQMYKA